MSNALKIKLAALGVVVAAIAGFMLLKAPLSDSAFYQQQAQDNALRYKTYAEQQIRAECNRQTGFERVKCVEEIRHQQRAYYRDEHDLVAQRQAALWGYATMIAAVIGMLSSFIGIALVWTTFHETRKANVIARQALRPWIDISIETTPIVDFGTDMLSTYDIVIKNTGQWFANDVKLFCQCFEFQRQHPNGFDVTKFDWSKHEPETLGAIPIDGVRRILGGLDISRLTSESIQYVVAVKITYDTGGAGEGKTVQAFNIRPTATGIGGYERLTTSTPAGTPLTAYQNPGMILT